MEDPKTGSANVPQALLHDWVAALDDVLEELEHDLVRRSIVHLSTLRAELVAAAQSSAQARSLRAEPSIARA